MEWAQWLYHFKFDVICIGSGCGKMHFHGFSNHLHRPISQLSEKYYAEGPVVFQIWIHVKHSLNSRVRGRWKMPEEVMTTTDLYSTFDGSNQRWVRNCCWLCRTAVCVHALHRYMVMVICEPLLKWFPLFMGQQISRTIREGRGRGGVRATTRVLKWERGGGRRALWSRVTHICRR